MVEPTCSLCHKRQDISKDKDLGQPADPDDGKVRGVEHPDSPAQNHVDGGREESRCQEDRQRLQDIGALFPFRLFLCCLEGPSGISDCLDCLVPNG